MVVYEDAEQDRSGDRSLWYAMSDGLRCPAYSIISKTPDVAIDERGLVRNVHLFVCVHNAIKYYIVD